MTDATPQPTGSGAWIWRVPLTRDVVDCAQFATAEAVPADLAPTTFAKLAIMFPDPRDARIAELEAALREIHKITGSYTGHGESARVFAAWRIADAALMPPPEGDMTMAVEEWDA